MHVRRIESDVDVARAAERAHEEARDHEEQRRSRDLRRDESAPQPELADPRQRRLLLERERQVGTGGLQRGRQPEHEARPRA